MSSRAVRRLADWPADRLTALADEHGTPLYVYDLDRVRANAARLTAAFPAAEVSYAVKANATRAVLATVSSAGLGAECASAGEVERALAAGFPDERVRYTAVNPPESDLDRVLELAADRELSITAGARDTVDRLAERGFEGRLLVRVNPGVGAGHHAKVRTGDAPQFGVPADRLEEVVLSAIERGLDVVGVHAHAGSGIAGDDLASHRAFVERVGDLARAAPADLEVVNVGGGFGVPSHPGEEPLDLEAVAAATREALGDLDATLAIEPGRYVVADAGVLVTRVNTVKPAAETTVVGVDAGMTTLVRPAMYGAHHEIRSLAPDADAREGVPSTVAGPVCETADVLGTPTLPAPERGDLLAVGTAGAYGYEMASHYNSRPRPAVLALEGDEAALAVERETLSDITRLETDRW